MLLVLVSFQYIYLDEILVGGKETGGARVPHTNPDDGITGLNCQVTEQLESWDLVMDGSTKAQAEKGWEGCPFCEGTVGMHGTLMCEGFDSI